MAARSSLTGASDYLANEASSTIRHEYVAGKVYAMAGASRNHMRIVTNLTVMLDSLLDEGHCENLVPDLKFCVADANAYFYPDATISS